MEMRGIEVIVGEVVTAIDKHDARYTVTLTGGRKIGADRVMFAVGRKPNIANLGIEQAGIRTAPLGGIAVDAYSRSSAPNIYAIRDVTNRINLTPVPIREGHAFADPVFGSRPTIVDHTNGPPAVFPDP